MQYMNFCVNQIFHSLIQMHNYLVRTNRHTFLANNIHNQHMCGASKVVSRFSNNLEVFVLAEQSGKRQIDCISHLHKFDMLRERFLKMYTSVNKLFDSEDPGQPPPISSNFILNPASSCTYHNTYLRSIFSYISCHLLLEQMHLLQGPENQHM